MPAKKRKSASTRAGKYVRTEMKHKKAGEHRRWSRKQTIAVGLAKARRAGVKVPRRKSRRASRRKEK
jgi:hypothetical protein